VDEKEYTQAITVENDPNAPAGAVITDVPELLGKENKPKLPRKEVVEEEVPREED
jgi:hypothetical protein